MKEEVTKISLVNNSGGYNLVGDTLTFESNLGTVAMDLRSGLEVAYTLIDCLNLDYYKNTVEDAEMKIVEMEDSISEWEVIFI